jgi:Gram-negative bacterial TonB protein C-terminal
MILAPDDRRELQRWLLSGAVVLFAHVGIAVAMVQWREPMEEEYPEGEIVIVELAPVPVAPMEVPNDMPPPEQVEPEILRTSSGSPLLDRESLELVRRVEPFPPAPRELAGEEIKLTVPIRFSAR